MGSIHDAPGLATGESLFCGGVIDKGRTSGVNIRPSSISPSRIHPFCTQSLCASLLVTRDSTTCDGSISPLNIYSFATLPSSVSACACTHITHHPPRRKHKPKRKRKHKRKHKHKRQRKRKNMCAQR